jgi:dihydrofolate synthase/folylpolyglutamate synthase
MVSGGGVLKLNYHEAVEYLQNLTRFGFNFGLGRVTELLRRVGNPHLPLQVIHIGGTNGKGSTLAMVAAILKAAGYRAGTFISPHLHSYTERYCINGVEISFERVAQLITSLRTHLDAMVSEGFEHPTEFEVSTALAFQYFLEEKVDFLVLEVGLGGAIDSTNVVNPLVSVITNVSMDHMDYLGSTVKDIATVKAGIIKNGVPVVTAAGDGEALEVIYKTCQHKDSPLVRVENGHLGKQSSPLYRQVFWEAGGEDFSVAGQRFSVKGLREDYTDLFLPLLGRHQLANASVAVATVDVLSEQGYAISKNAVCRGLAGTSWPARLEILGRRPLAVIDGAHNYDGAKSLRRALDDYFPEKEVVLVLGMLGDKQCAGVVAELAPRARAVVVTRPNSPRSGDWQRLAGEARRYVQEVYAVKCIKDAVLQGMEVAAVNDVVCITGSLYMVAEAREFLLGRRW